MKQIDYVRQWYTDPARHAGQLVRPRQLNFPVTDTCNSRCVMCDVWKVNAVDDMTLEQLEEVLRQPFFQDLEHVGISGGEPFLRKDLVEVVAAFCRLSKLKSLSITSHGFNHVRHRQMGPRIMEQARSRGVPFTINFSIDGVGVVHDRVRQVPGGFIKLEQTLELYRSLGAQIVGQCTVSKTNLHNLPDLDLYAREHGIDMIYRLATTIERLYNQDVMDTVALDRNEQSFFADFLVYSGVIERTQNPARRLFYRQLVETLQTGAPRAAPCYYQNEAVLLNANGTVYQCSIVEQAIGSALTDDVEKMYFSPENRAAMARVKRETCSRCPHDQTGAWPPHMLATEQMRATKAGRVAARLPELATKAATTAAAYALPSPPIALRPRASGSSGAKAVIIGCYGGEHVGDAAILGGVLLRLHRNHGLTEAVVLSSRPDRTEGWANQLDTPVMVQVLPYDGPGMKAAIPGADMLVIGGGPVMDLPALLAQHLRAARIARQNGVPLLAEGVGFGPFRRKVSQTLARKLLGATAEASFRTAKSFAAARSHAPAARQTIDPAFTYLEQVNAAHPPVPDFVGRLGRPGRPLIALNLRPLWARYATADFDEARVRAIEDRCIDVIRETVTGHPDCDFVFLPFNSDQLGQSDLNIAFQLRRAGKLGSNFHIWESEPTIDQLIGALQACDGLIAMRFHACIFGLSTGTCKVFGIDYGIGKASKVAELISEADDRATYAPVETVTAEQLSDFIDGISGTAADRLIDFEAV